MTNVENIIRRSNLLSPIFRELEMSDLVKPSILSKKGGKILIVETLKLYPYFTQPWKYYHDYEHIVDLYGKLKEWKDSEHSNLSKIDYEKLLCLIIFHDIIYFPWKNDNELQSAEYFKNEFGDLFKPEITKWVYDAILATKEHKKSKDDLLNLFLVWDMSVIEGDYKELLGWEDGIRKEYSFVSTSDYKKGRLDFLRKCEDDRTKDEPLDENYALVDLMDHVTTFKPKVGFYAGSFNPFHIGHLSIVDQAKKVYDKVVILIAQNPDKPTLTDEEIEKRKKQIFSACPGIEIQYVNGFVPRFLEERSKDEEIFLIRGIRNTMDWMAESNYLQYSLKIVPSLQVQYYTCPKEIEHVSSSGIRAMETIEEGSAKDYLPKVIVNG